VCSALTYSVLQCPGIMPGFTGDWHMGPLSGLCLQGWKKPWPRYGLWTIVIVKYLFTLCCIPYAWVCWGLKNSVVPEHHYLTWEA